MFSLLLLWNWSHSCLLHEIPIYRADEWRPKRFLWHNSGEEKCKVLHEVSQQKCIMLGMHRSHATNLNIDEIIVWCSLFFHQNARYPSHSKNLVTGHIKNNSKISPEHNANDMDERGRDCTEFGWDRVIFLHSSSYGAVFYTSDQNSVGDIPVP